MADNRKRAPRGGKQAASGSRPIRRNDRATAPKGRRDRTQAARPQRDRNRDAVQAPKGEFIEGRRAAAEALRTGFPIKCALIAEGGERDAALSRLVDDLNAAGVRIKYVPRAQLDALSSHGAHQGIALEVGNFPYADVADILDRAGDGPALVVVLDHVTDDGNFGAIVRSAEVVGAAGVIIANKRAAGVTVGSYKTSAGAVMHLPIAQVPISPERSMTSRPLAFGWAVLPSTPRAAAGMLPSRAAWRSSWAPRATASRAWCSRNATS